MSQLNLVTGLEIPFDKRLLVSFKGKRRTDWAIVYRDSSAVNKQLLSMDRGPGAINVDDILEWTVLPV